MKLYITESNLNFLTEFLNAIPIFVRDGQLFYATPSGLSFCSIHSGNRKREIPLDDWEPFDEVFYLPSIDRCVFAHSSNSGRPSRGRARSKQPVSCGRWFRIVLRYKSSGQFELGSFLVMGGAMTSLRRHRERAAAQDRSYEPWFSQRFGPASSMKQELSLN